jgi:hypothetical protein
VSDVVDRCSEMHLNEPFATIGYYDLLALLRVLRRKGVITQNEGEEIIRAGVDEAVKLGVIKR